MLLTIALMAVLNTAQVAEHAEDMAAQAAAGQAAPVAAQVDEHAEHAAAEGESGAEEHGEEHGFDIMHHIQDSREIELPFGNVIHLPPAGSWQVGPIDMTPTKHVVFLWIAGLITLLLFLPAARMAKRTHERSPSGGHNAIEALVLYLRNEVVMKNIGHGGEKFAPFVVTLFFFILVANLLGLLPWGATATGNVSVTAALALMTFAVTEVAGMRALGPAGYTKTIVFVPHGLPLPMAVLISLIMTPVELIAKFTKPFALTIRLFANMTAGHVLLLAIISLIFLFGSLVIAVGPVVMAIALTFLELFVSFLQAYIFALLSAVFIGLIQHAH